MFLGECGLTMRYSCFVLGQDKVDTLYHRCFSRQKSADVMK